MATVGERFGVFEWKAEEAKSVRCRGNELTRWLFGSRSISVSVGNSLSMESIFIYPISTYERTVACRASHAIGRWCSVLVE